MKNLGILLILSISVLLSGCSGKSGEKSVDRVEESYVAVDSLADTANSVEEATRRAMDEEYFKGILMERQELKAYGILNQVQVVCTDMRGTLSAIVMTFRNEQGVEFIANAVMKESNVLKLQVVEMANDLNLNYKLEGSDEKEGDYILYSGIAKDNKAKIVSFVHEDATVVDVDISDQRGYCYLSLKKESNSQQITNIQQKDRRGTILYEIDSFENSEKSTFMKEEDEAEAAIEAQAVTVVVTYYKQMYQAYYDGNVTEAMFSECLDMTKIQNKNKITAMKKLNMNWNYFRTIYPDYRQPSAIVALHLESITKKENGTYEVLIQINGNRMPADYPSDDYLVGINPYNLEQSQMQVPPFVSLGQNTFQLNFKDGKLLIEKHIYNGQANFEGMDSVEVPFDAAAYQQQLERTRWGQSGAN